MKGAPVCQQQLVGAPAQVRNEVFHEIWGLHHDGR
jgi:hypothetical protein